MRESGKSTFFFATGLEQKESLRSGPLSISGWRAVSLASTAYNEAAINTDLNMTNVRYGSYSVNETVGICIREGEKQHTTTPKNNLVSGGRSGGGLIKSTHQRIKHSASFIIIIIPTIKAFERFIISKVWLPGKYDKSKKEAKRSEERQESASRNRSI